MNELTWSRFQFGFTASFHYIFPQLTMGLALIILIFKVLAYRQDNEVYDKAARFWGRIFGIGFAVGVVTGIPLEFQFGTNWGAFSNFTGGVIGLTLAMEGLFAFFAESAFLGLFLFGEKRLGKKGHLLATLMLFLGAWLSGYFIVATNAFMQHPVGYAMSSQGRLELTNLPAYLFNPWAIVQYAHTMSGSAITGAFVVAAVGAFYTLMNVHLEQAKVFLRIGVITGLLASLLQLFPTGDLHGKMVAKHQPVALAAMEAKFQTEQPADLAIIGQPDLKRRTLENPVYVPALLSFLAYGTFGAEVKGLEEFPEKDWPDNIELLYYAYRIMVGLGTFFILIMGAAAGLLYRGSLISSKAMLWVLMLAFPFPFIANTAGWMTAELGRQPWLIYGLMRTKDGASPLVSGGNAAFSSLGFMGLYFVLGVLFLYLIMHEVKRGPASETV